MKPESAARLTISLVLLLAAPSPAAAQGRFTWDTSREGAVELLDAGKPVLTYFSGPQLKAGAPENRRRCCYIFPLYTPGGVSVLDDFPADHPHHRGLFWAWPVVETGGQTYDHWMNMTALTRTGKPPRHSAGAASAQLEAFNVWHAGGKDIVRENLKLTVYPAQGNARELAVELTLEAITAPVTLKGSREAGKSYGGLSARFARRQNTVIRADGQTVTRDEDLVPHAWAELEAAYNGRRAALRITPDPKDPGAPYQWCLRDYGASNNFGGFVGASFPGRTAQSDGYTLQPGKPLTLHFRVRVSDIP